MHMLLPQLPCNSFVASTLPNHRAEQSSQRRIAVVQQTWFCREPLPLIALVCGYEPILCLCLVTVFIFVVAARQEWGAC